MRRMRTWWVSVMFLSACGGGGGKVVALDDLDEALADAFCDMSIDCGRVTSRADCEQSSSFNDTRQLVASVQAGKIRYDGAATADCLAWFSTLCSKPSFDDTRCTQAFKGQLAVGGACLSNLECASTRCDDTGCDDTVACCRGVCLEAIPRVPVGGACGNADATCVSGSYCNYVESPGVSTCKLPEMIQEGKACDGIYSCASGLYCNKAKVCARPPKRGEACDPSEYRCPFYQDYCDPQTRVCTAKRTAGETCYDFTTCAEGSRCYLGSCVADKHEGDVCLTGDCAPELECQEGTCVKPPPDPVCP